MFDSIADARQSLTRLREALARKGDLAATEAFNIIAALQQMFDIAEAVDEQDQALTVEEITDIGEQGLALIDQLDYILSSRNLNAEKQDAGQVALVIAQWVISHGGVLTNIQSVVDGLASVANALHDKATLSRLSKFMGRVAHACSDAIKHDLDNTDPARPWRVLNINRGIVATRSHDLDVMTQAFADLIQAIPMDAPRFFKEGMSEMVRLNYPEPVRELMQEFYERTALPSVH